MDFKTVFVFTDKIPAIVNDDLHSLILAIVGFFLVIGAKNFRKEWALKSVRLLGFTVTITLIVFSGLFGLRDYQKYREFAEVYNQARYQVVEGVVEILPVSDRARNKHDQIRIANMEFTIDYYYHTFGYSQIIVQGGVLRAGTHVRVYYYQGEILRIDLRNSKNTDGVQSGF